MQQSTVRTGLVSISPSSTRRWNVGEKDGQRMGFAQEGRRREESGTVGDGEGKAKNSLSPGAGWFNGSSAGE